MGVKEAFVSFMIPQSWHLFRLLRYCFYFAITRANELQTARSFPISSQIRPYYEALPQQTGSVECEVRWKGYVILASACLGQVISTIKSFHDPLNLGVSEESRLICGTRVPPTRYGVSYRYRHYRSKHDAGFEGLFLRTLIFR